MNSKLKSLNKYFFFFFHRVGKETWQMLPWRAKVGLVLLDIILIAFCIYGIILIIQKFVLGHAVTCESCGRTFF